MGVIVFLLCLAVGVLLAVTCNLFKANRDTERALERAETDIAKLQGRADALSFMVDEILGALRRYASQEK